MEITRFFQKLRQEEMERIGKKRKMWADQSRESSSPQIPLIAGVSKGAANPQVPFATALIPIIESHDPSIDKAPPKMQSSSRVEFPKAPDNTSPPTTSSPGARIVDSTDASSSPRPPPCAATSPVTEEDFLVSKRKFKPKYRADITRLFYEICVKETRKMGRPEREYESPLWVKVPI